MDTTITTTDLDLNAPDLDLGVEELDELLAPWDWGDFFTGVGTGVALVGLYGAGVAAAT